MDDQNTQGSMMEFTPKRIERLQKAYDKAVANKQDQFTFEGHEFVTAYAKYLLEYLRGPLNNQ